MEILEKSFQAQSLGSLVASFGFGDDDEDGGSIQIPVDTRMQLALDDYIKERKSQYDTGIKE